jgi:hypothetical protein
MNCFVVRNIRHRTSKKGMNYSVRNMRYRTPKKGMNFVVSSMRRRILGMSNGIYRKLFHACIYISNSKNFDHLDDTTANDHRPPDDTVLPDSTVERDKSL